MTLKQDLSASPLVVVGHCACVEAKSTLKKLETLSLPTPSWSDTVEVARALFPGGCEVGKGLWVCVESKITAHQIWGTLRTETDVMVRLCVRVRDFKRAPNISTCILLWSY